MYTKETGMHMPSRLFLYKKNREQEASQILIFIGSCIYIQKIL